MIQSKINDICYEILVTKLKENKNKKIAFWGASLIIEEFLNNYDLSEYNIVGIIDKNIERIGKKIKNLPIISPEEIEILNLDKIFLTIKNNSSERYKEVINYLANKNLNIYVEEIFKKENWILYCQNLISDKKIPIRNSIIYIPDYPTDHIQNIIVETCDFYEINDLKYLDQYLDSKSVVLDIGANIGNHTIYWGKITNVEKVYSFEPIKSTFEKLKVNVEINNLENKVKIYNVGVGKVLSRANIDNYNATNCGASTIAICPNGNIEIITIDSLAIEDKISLIKIDTEGFELDVLKGAVETIKKHKPLIYVEIDSQNLIQAEAFFEKYNYRKEKQVKDTNYLFAPKE